MLFLSCSTILHPRHAKSLLIFVKRSKEQAMLAVKFIELFLECTFRVDVLRGSHQLSKTNLSMLNTQRLVYLVCANEVELNTQIRLSSISQPQHLLTS